MGVQEHSGCRMVGFALDGDLDSAGTTFLGALQGKLDLAGAVAHT